MNVMDESNARPRALHRGRDRECLESVVLAATAAPCRGDADRAQDDVDEPLNPLTGARDEVRGWHPRALGLLVAADQEKQEREQRSARQQNLEQQIGPGLLKKDREA